MPWLMRAIFSFSNLGNNPFLRLPWRHTLVGESDHLLSLKRAGLHLEPQARSVPVPRCSRGGQARWEAGFCLPLHLISSLLPLLTNSIRSLLRNQLSNQLKQLK